VKLNQARLYGEESEQLEVARTAEAVILYDHLETLLAANELLGQVESNDCMGAEWRANSWRFDMLRKDFCLEAYRALEESVDAELVVAAVRDHNAWAKLPLEWLEQWADYRWRPSSRLLLMTFGSAETSAKGAPVIGALRLLADSRALPFSILSGSNDRQLHYRW